MPTDFSRYFLAIGPRIFAVNEHLFICFCLSLCLVFAAVGACCYLNVLVLSATVFTAVKFEIEY